MKLTRNSMRDVIHRLALTLGLAGAIVLWLAASSALAQQIPIAGTAAPQTGDFTPSGDSDVTQAEFPGQVDTDAGPGPYPGTIVNLSLSTGTGRGVSVNSGKKAKSNPAFDNGFEGLNLYQQRYVRGQRLRARGGQRCAQRLRHLGAVGAPGQHRRQHRLRPSEECEPCR